METLLDLDKLLIFVQNVGSIIGACAVLATFTPTPAAGSFLAKLKRLLDIAAMNIGNAKNAK